MHQEGNAGSAEKGFGKKCTHKIVRPDMCFVFDKTGGNTCIKNDGQNGGTRYTHRPGSRAKIRASESDNHFTSLMVSALFSEAALCDIIFKGEIECIKKFNSKIYVYIPN